ncbi:uncharacterized protein LOC124154233 [Ischnura elegans]|uniref:uncharacterized protein LOC124154233 n=1 Tax=Ischnura elegans TaxID=197161 RepID=UPI001ED8B9D7|nr:uncharacterized protein LOC124154233 [Ischnura elegans]
MMYYEHMFQFQEKEKSHKDSNQVEVEKLIIRSEDHRRGNLCRNFTILYGEDILRKSKRFEKLRKKRGKLLSSLAFLQRCRDTNTLPTCVEVKHHLNTYAAKKILRHTSEALLRERIHHKRLELHLCSEELYRIHLELGATLTATDWEKIDKISFESSRALETTHRESQIKKYEKLNSRQHPKLESGPDKDRSIVNLTDLHIDDATTSVLATGLNFAITPRDIPREEIITEVETGIRKLPRLVADEIREDVARVLRNAKPPKPNMTAGERTALKALRENQDILILPADKGNATVLMEKEEYQKKISELLSDTIYRKLGKNPMAKAERETKAIIKKSSIPPEEKRGLITSAPKPPRMYGLPKVHKEGVPLRPIVSQIDAPTYRLAKYLARTLQDHTGTTTTHVKNSAHFVEMIRDMTIANEDIMVSFDVVSLFTNVPIAESVEISDGAAMGSPLSPVVANLFMERFEAEAINTYGKKPKIWLRYVDDTFIIWPHGTEGLDRFLNHLNSRHQNIRFTMEKERDGKLPFLDVMVRRKGDGSLRHAIYRKTTHTNRYLNAMSHHHPAQKASVVSSLLHRTFTVSDADSLESEKRLLTTALRKNGYNQKMVLKRAENVAKLHARPPMERHTTEEDSVAPVAKLTIPSMTLSPGRKTKSHRSYTRVSTKCPAHVGNHMLERRVEGWPQG